jgi:1,4-dihydroxy-2-naphthoate octaprenyltransferase
MTKNQAWIKALRLRTLPLSISGVLLGSFIAKSEGFWSWTIFGMAMLTTLLFQVISNLSNDLGDSLKGTDNSNRVGPMRSVQSGLISKKEMKTAVILTSLAALASATILIYLGSKDLPVSILWMYLGLAILCIIAAITYTLGKKAYGYQGLGDLMVFLFFGLVSVLGVYPLYAKTVNWNLLLPAVCIGLLSVAVLNLNNMRDRVNDARSGKNTLVVKMGPNAAKLYHTMLILIGLICHIIYIYHLNNEKAFLGLLPGVVLFFHIRKVMGTKDPKDFDPELIKVALSTFAIAILTAIGMNI